MSLLASAAQSLTRLATSSASVSLTSILLGAAIPLTGPLGAAIVGCISAVDPGQKRPFAVRVFNVSMTGLVGAIGGLTYLGLDGVVLHDAQLEPLLILGRQGIPLAIATVVMLLVNTGCVSVMIAVNGGAPMLVTWRRITRQVGRTYLGYGVVGFLFAVLWDPVGLGPATVLVMFVPLVFAQWSYAQQHAESVAHERTVASLVAAGEARDPIMSGRIERVAQVSELLGNELRLSPADADALHFAALLHDVGMVAPVEGRHRDNDDIRADNLERIRRHPSRGVDMLRSIEFLGDSITAIRHHHERWDGRGYPDGLAGPQIPQLARVLAVSDAFCALVPRVGAERTMELLRDRAGVQFDPECVDAMDKVASIAADLAALDRGPQAEVIADTVIDDRWIDHDLPEVSDLLAGDKVQP
ncbi:HD-GYP domain-containing protein [Flexivirga sp.]|uniref:HD-GYP domain-containing protein n=1 Tax=Flexivirga sp. TaxID=1962927 RepID=UPI003F80632E